MKLPIIGITCGDPGGIGPEVVLKALLKNHSQPAYTPVLFGSSKIFSDRYYSPWIKKIQFIDCDDQTTAHVKIEKSKPSKHNGLLAFQSICKAVEYCLAQKVHAMVTAPICKKSFQLAQLQYTDHTTLLSHLTQSTAVSMGFFTPQLKTVLATIHVPYAKVPELLTEQAIQVAIQNSFRFAQLLGIKSPKIAIAGLNPHAGESGLFGTEEETLIQPVLNRLPHTQQVFGPYPADTLYYRAAKGDFDIVISLYHDQGLIPIKLIGFEYAVNVTLGLPIIRTSPDHGTAFDIAFNNQANSESFEAAVNLACSMIKRSNT